MAQYVVVWHDGEYRHAGHQTLAAAEEACGRVPTWCARGVFDATGHYKGGGFFFDEAWERKIRNYAEALGAMQTFGLHHAGYVYTETRWTTYRTLHLCAHRESGRRLLLKHPWDAYPRGALEAACEYCTHRSHLAGGVAPGGVGIMRYQPSFVDGRYTQICYSNQMGRDTLWICGVYIENAVAIADVGRPPGGQQQQQQQQQQQHPTATTRVLLARALGALHSEAFTGQIPDGRTLEPTRELGWIGTVRQRAEWFVGCGDGGDLARVLAWVVAARGARIDALAKRVLSTGDFQTKNVVVGGVGLPADHLTIVNAEILQPLNPLWDVVWLLLLDDAAVGATPRLLHELAWAVRVYKFHSGLTFTDGEIFLFPNIVQVKAAFVGHVLGAAGRACHDVVLRVARDAGYREGLRAALRSAMVGDRLYGVPSATDAISIPFKTPEGGRRPRGLLLHYNGSFAPCHHGHFRALLLAADGALRAFGGHLLGGFFSPCHDAFLHAKLVGKEQHASMLPATIRVALLNTALHSLATRALAHEVLGPPQWAASAWWVETFECKHSPDVTSLRRLAAAIEALPGSSDSLVCVMGCDALAQARWFLDFHPRIKCAIVKRPGIRPEEVAAVDRVVAAFPGRACSVMDSGTAYSSTAVRDARSYTDIAHATGLAMVAARAVAPPTWPLSLPQT